jgi:hypothetical protein
MIMVSSFYSVQYIIKFSHLSFLSSGASTSLYIAVPTLTPINKYCVFAHNIRY